MPIEYVVQQGDCVSSIAAEHGLLPETIWNDPANADLKKKRDNGNILYPGDVITIPDIRIREETRPTTQRHVFKRKGVPEKFKIILLDDRDLPRKGLKYVLVIDGERREGTTKGDGSIEEPISPKAQSGMLTIYDGAHVEQHPLKLGHLDPLTEVSGVQMRLSNLGYDCPTDGELNDATVEAILAFQQEHTLEPTGKITDEMRSKLKQAYGS